jgi:hypothetical protein
VSRKEAVVGHTEKEEEPSALQVKIAPSRSIAGLDPSLLPSDPD